MKSLATVSRWGRTCVRSLVSVAVLFAGWQASALAGITGVGGELLDVSGSPPTSVALNALEDQTNFRIFKENGTTAHVLTSAQTCIGASGNITIPSGTPIDVYFVHADPATANKTFTGTASFQPSVLCVIRATADLTGTDASLGRVGTTYTPVPNTRASTETNDTLTGVGTNTVAMNFQVNNTGQADQARIITASPVCRFLKLTSSAPSVGFFGTAAYISTYQVPPAPSYSVALQPVETGTGTVTALIYNNGQFPTDCSTTADCLGTSNGALTPSTTDLTGLVLTGSGGAQVSFTDGVNYTYTGGKFSNHSGTYSTLRDCGKAPEPGTLLLMLLPLAGLRAIRGRWQSA